MFSIYERPNCVQCTMTKRSLEKNGLKYTTSSLSEERIEEFKSEGLMQAPVVLAPNGEKWAGFQPTRIESFKDALLAS